MKEEINTLLDALTDSKNNQIVNALDKILNVILSDSSAALLSISSLPESDTKDALLHLFRPVAGLGMALSAVKNHLETPADSVPEQPANPQVSEDSKSIDSPLESTGVSSAIDTTVPGSSDDPTAF